MFKKTIFSILIQCFLLSFYSNASIDTFFDQYKYAYENKNPFPLISTQQSSFNLNMAYKLQKKWSTYLEESNKKLGYKAALTSITDQKKHNINSPISGTIIDELTYQNFDIIPLSTFNNPLLEIELGFYLSTDITQPLSSTAILKNYIKKIVCVVELPDVNLEQTSKANIIDLVGINSASKSIIMGEEISKRTANTPFEITVKFDNKNIDTITIDNLLESQLDTLLWLVNHIVTIEGIVKKDNILLTGALNTINNIKKGRYVINYGHTTSIVFKTI